MRSIEEKIIPSNKIETLCEKLRAAGKKIVTTNGCFDLIHLGHISYLIDARKLGDVLIVGLNSDSSVKNLKGPSRPIQSELTRAKQLGGLESVDFVTIFSEDTPETLLNRIKPAIHVKGGDYSPDQLPEKAVVEASGGKVVCVSVLPGFSTTDLIKKIKITT